MDHKKLNAREKILQTVVDMLMAETNVENITVRSIAEKAKVNSALINYYFQSKDQLISKAMEVCMSNFTDRMYEEANLNISPFERLMTMITDIADFSFQTPYLSRIAVSSDLNHGSIHTAQILLPVLKQISPKKSDVELKTIAMQIIIPIQVLFLNSDSYNQYFNIKIEDKNSRDKILYQIVKNLFNEESL